MHFSVILFITCASLAFADYYIDSLGQLTEKNLIDITSSNFTRPALISFYPPNCPKCEDFNYPLVEALHAFRGSDLIVAHMDAIEAVPVLKNCELNLEAEIPEWRLFLPGKPCKENPYRNYNLEWVSKELNFKMKKSHFVELTEETFDSFTGTKNKQTIVELYAPRCRSCQNQYNDLERVLTVFNSDPVQFGKLNCDRFLKICQQFTHAIFPAFLFYKNGQYMQDAEQPSVQGDSGLLTYFNELFGLDREMDGSITDRLGLNKNITRKLDSFMNGDKSDREEVMKWLRTEGRELSNAKLYYGVMKSVMEHGKGWLRTERTKRVKSHKEMGVYSHKYPSSKVLLNIINSFLRYDFTGMVTLNDDNFDKIVNGKRNVLCVFFKKDCDTCEEFKREFNDAAQRGVPGVVFASVNANKFKSIAKRFNHHKNPSLKFFAKGADPELPEEVAIPAKKERFIDFLTDRVDEMNEAEAEAEKAAQEAEFAAAGLDVAPKDQSLDDLPTLENMDL